MSGTWKKRLLLVGMLAGIALAVRDERKSCAQTADASCDTASTAPALTGTTLNTHTPTRSGVQWDSSASALKLNGLSGSTLHYTTTLSSSLNMACAADFDGDGNPDIAGTDTTTGFLKVFKNQTTDNPAPNWSDSTQGRAPKFGPTVYTVESSSTYKGLGAIGCGDINGDGKNDIVLIRCTSGSGCTNPTRAVYFLGNGDGTFGSPVQLVKNLSTIGQLSGKGSHIAIYDVNRDTKNDIVLGEYTATTSTTKKGVTTTTGGGRVAAYLNDGKTSPGFGSQATVVIDNLLMGSSSHGATTIAIGDFNNDNVVDIIVGADDQSDLRLYPGSGSSGVPSYTSPYLTFSGFTGGAVAVSGGDWTMDGKLDAFVSTTSAGLLGGGYTYRWDNSGSTATPFSLVSAILDNLLAILGLTPDFDYGFVTNYDADPQSAPDYIAGSGATLYVSENRPSSGYVTCGTVATDDLDLGTVPSTITIVDGYVTPTITLNGGTASYEMSNDGGATWHSASLCSGSTTNYCASFGTTAGSKLRWRATLCSDSTHTATPTLTTMGAHFTYVSASKHFRSGPVAVGGLVYTAAFEEPGDAGYLFAIDDASGTTLWEAASKLDSQSTRHVYTVSQDGSTLLTFATSNQASADLQNTLLTTDDTSTGDLITWWLGTRFGQSLTHKMGGIVNSTPAVLTGPNKPYWYYLAGTTTSERTAIDSFITKYTSRQNLVFVGSKDGAFHAFYTNPTSSTASTNGQEAWAYIPYFAAQALVGEKTSGTMVAYPDGSPTLADAKVNGEWRTIAIESGGAGGNSIFALDVTDTVPTTGVVGPTPMWRFTDANMGLAVSKPAIVRAKKGTTEEWLVVFASGKGATADVGDSVYAVDLYTGNLTWRFDLGDNSTYIATDVVALETKDETGTSIDGYVDRIVFGDNKGRLWKLDPTADSGGKISSMGTVDVGLTQKALFSTKSTSGALGEERAISGSIASGTDASGRLALYFGTGGTDDSPNGVQNEFYAVYLDTGELRGKIGAAQGIAVGRKFYGGVIFNAGQLIFTTGQDLSGTGLCSPSAGTIVAVDANTFASEFSTDTTSKIVAPLFVQNGEVYTVTMTGSLMMSAYTGSSATSSSGGSGGGGGTSGKTNNGNGGNNGNGNGNSGGGSGGTGGSGGGGGTSSSGTNMTGVESDPFSILSWVQVF
jgi:Tfp pilus tip-associated adhesin PilY1